MGVAAFLIATLIAGFVATASPANADTGCPTAVAPTQSGSTYLISSPGNFQWLKDANVSGSAAQLAYSYRQTANIDFTGCTWTSSIASGAAFTGTYDGAGFTISNLTVTHTLAPYVGVFANVTSGATITNAHLRSVAVTASGDNGVGALVGHLVNGTVARSSATGSVTAGTAVGGLVGNNYGIIEDSWANVSVTADYYAGGLVGFADYTGVNQAIIRRSFASGSVVATGASTGGAGFAGGLVGLMQGGRIEDSYATASVTSTSSIAGLVFNVNHEGGMPSGVQSAVLRSYAIGAVQGTGYGFSGSQSGAPTFTANFWSPTTTMQGSAGQTASATSRTTAQMKDVTTYASAGWSITDGYSTSTTWGICAGFNDGYPFLTALQSSNVCGEGVPSQWPPSWHKSIGRAAFSDPCPVGWTGSWAQWPNSGAGGFVCNQETYWNAPLRTWSTRTLPLVR